MKPIYSLMATVCASLFLTSPVVAQTSVAAPPATFQDHFDPLGPAVQGLAGPSGRMIHYADTGEAGWRPVLFLGGTGTSARAFLMTGYLESLRKQLHLRLITVERNGFGDTPYDPAWTFADYTAEVRVVLDHLGVDRFAMIAISGGGPYAGRIAAAMPERLISVHMAAAAANVHVGEADFCSKPVGDVVAGLAPTIQDPQKWWGYPPSSPTHQIPGFADRAFDEGARTFFIRGQMGDPTPEAAEMRRYCDGALPALSKVKAPLFTYYGSADTLVVPANGAYWRAAVGGPVTARDYPGEGHDAQYRHWDQILIDMAGFGDRLLVCSGGKAQLLPGKAAADALARGGRLGLCVWH